MIKFVAVGATIIGLGTLTFFIWYHSKKKYRIEIQIPNTVVGYVIGRNSENTKRLQTMSKAKIRFIAPDVTSDRTTCVITGDQSSVMHASSIISKLIKNYQDNEDNFSFNFNEFKLEDSIDQSGNNLSTKFEQNAIKPSYLGEEKDEFYEVQGENVADFIPKRTQKLCSSRGDGLLPVYVSAVSSPEKFWVQAIKTKEHADLDRLTMDMSEYFESNPQFNVPPKISDLKPGYLCSVFYESDKRWYRAQVNSVSNISDGTFNTDTVVELYLLDYGESFIDKVTNIRPIPSEFLKLDFQAVECGLSNVKAINGKWNEESIQFFEDLVHVGQWYTLLARVDFDEDGYRPYIALIDTNGESFVNIAEKLVAGNFAKMLG